ncbi:DENN domain-containing protein 1B isoform X2 [Myripristis murdjan]|uniref:DENN domain-containing protein 1B isoform X2 n=1 Tax=Myripristis murdjan TaxID=586833 RepID=UPI001175EC8C|nr:DENN domain-containing protein 1B-like isoform X2 [Myripristis murdjan]
MGSRLKKNPERTFYWFFEATGPIARDKDPGVLFQFPEDFCDEESCKTLPKFCFPYDIQRVRDGVAVQHFTFVLTDLEGCQRFGFCRLTNSTQTCLCMLSYLPWFEVFYKLLNNLADYLTKGQTNEMKLLLAALYKQPIPLAAGSVTLQMVPYFIAPDPRSLPSIPESRNLTELIVAVDMSNLLQIYASMLFERRILIFASKLSTLTACVHALSAVIYPMYWQHIFIPILPPHLLDYCCAPMPYLIGVHSSLSEKVRSRGLEEVVILNVDTNTLETTFDDLKRIPSDVMSGLKVRLKRQAVSPGCGVAKAFLRAQALLFGGYRDAVQGDKTGEMWFNEELFLHHRSPSMRQFLQSAIHLQFFKQFIDDRMEILNKGKEPDDLFEEEILQCGATAGRGTSYQQLVGNLKKGGGAIILNMKSKANMKAKGLTKMGLKNLLIHKDHSEAHALQRGGSVSHRRAQSDCLQSRLPITQHFGMSRPRRPVHKHRAPGEEENTEDTTHTWDGAVSMPATEPDSELQKDEEEEEALLCDPEEMDLLGEIFDTLSSRSSHERGLLYGTRSLDLFGPDSHDYITKRGLANPSQESLSLSISGSDSLHSWNLEEGLQTTDKVSELAEDSDWLSMDASILEEEVSESLLLPCDVEEQGSELREHREKGEQQGEMNGSKGEVTAKINYKTVELAEDKTKEDQENKLGLEEMTAKEQVARQEDDELGEKEVDGNQSDEVIVIREVKEEAAEIQKDLVREGEGQERQQERKAVEMTGSSHSNRSVELCAQSDCHPNGAEVVDEHQRQDETASAKPPPSPESQMLPADTDLKPQAGQEKSNEEAGGKEEPEVGQTPRPPKVLSVVARFQSQAPKQGPQTKSLAEPGRPCSMLCNLEKVRPYPQNDSNTPSDVDSRSEPTEAQETPPIKVSELKKRFEA